MISTGLRNNRFVYFRRSLKRKNLWHSPAQKGKVRWGAKHSPPANMSSSSATIAEQMMQRHLQLGMQRQPQTNKALLQRSFTLQLLLATSEQDAAHNATTHHQAINQSLCKMHQEPATQQVKEKRVARAHAHEARAELLLREKIDPGPLISTLERILPLHFKIRRISDKPESHRSALARAISAFIFAHTS